MDTVFIYALNCPVSGRNRYVGKASNPDKRYAGHLRTKKKCHCGNWVRSVLATGEKPILEIIDEVPEAEWPSWEVAYIQFYRDEGCDLVNATCGGEGGANPTAETRAKLRAANLGKKLSPEHCEKMRAANLGKKLSPETRAKTSASLKGNKNCLGKKLSRETRVKLSAAMSGEKHHFFGKKLSSEHCAKLSAARFGKIVSPETRAKLSAASLGRKHSLETRAKMSAASLGKPKSAEHRAKVSAANLGKTLSLEHRANISVGLLKFNSEKGVEYGGNRV